MSTYAIQIVKAIPATQRLTPGGQVHAVYRSAANHITTFKQLRQELFGIPSPIVPDDTYEFFCTELAILPRRCRRIRHARIHRILKHFNAQTGSRVYGRLFVTEKRGVAGEKFIRISRPETTVRVLYP